MAGQLIKVGGEVYKTELTMDEAFKALDRVFREAKEAIERGDSVVIGSNYHEDYDPPHVDHYIYTERKL